MRLDRKKRVNAGALPVMPDVMASKDVFGSSPTLLYPVSGDKGRITDKDAIRTIAEVMRAEGEMGREEGGEIRQNSLELLNETIEYITNWCSLGM